MKTAQYLLALIAVASVLAFGGDQPIVWRLMVLTIGVLAFFVFWKTGWPDLPRIPATLVILLMLAPWIQILPLPRSVLAFLSPAWASTQQAILAPWGLAGKYLAISVQTQSTVNAGLRLVCYLLVFLLGFQFHRRGVPAILPALLAGIGLFEASYGLVQYLTGWQYIFSFAKVFYIQDATGTYINRNHFAGLLEMVLPFIVAGTLITGGPDHRPNPWRRRLASSDLRPLRAIVLLTFVALALVFSRSRMGILSGLAGVLLVLILAFRQGRHRSISLILLALAIPAIYALWIGIAPVTDRYELLGHPHALESDRLPLWRDALSLIRDHPWTGVGLGTYNWASPSYQTAHFEWRVDYAHNDYLQFAAELGLPLAILMFAGLWVLVGRTARLALILPKTEDRVLAAGCAGAMAALLVHSLADFNLQIPANATLFAWIAGVSTGLLSGRKEEVC
jgi:O-antigen ligase